MMFLKQSTAVDVPLGPFLDSTDGNTAETGLTITQPDIRLKKNGGAWAQKSAAQTLSHEEAGWYEVSLSTTDTDTLGHLILAAHESGALPVWREFHVVSAMVYDSLFGSGDTLDVQVTGIGNDVITAASIAASAIGSSELADGAITAAKVATDAIDADAMADGAITAATFAASAINAAAIAADAITAAKIADGAIDSATFAAGAINAAAIATDAITAAKIAADAIGASELAADAVTEIQSGLATAAALTVVDDFLDTEVAAIKAKTDLIPTDPAETSDIPTAATIADAVWDEATSGHTTGGTFGAQAKTLLDTIATYIDTEVASILAAVDTEVAAIKAKTDLIPTDPAATGDIPTAGAVADAVWDESLAAHNSAGSTGEALADAGGSGASAADIADAVLDEALSGHATAGTLGKAMADVLAAVDTEIAAVLAAVDTEVAAIKAKTDLIPTDPAETSDIPTADAIRDAVWAKAMSELADVPGVTDSVLSAMQWLFLLSRNKVTQTSTTSTLRNDADNADIAAAATSDNGSTFTRGTWA